MMKWLSNILDAFRPLSVIVNEDPVINERNTPRFDTDRLIKDLEKQEGMVLSAYQDHLGYWTIGIGRLIDKRRRGRITVDEAYYLLTNDITRKEIELYDKLPWLSKHPENVQRALMNMSFQMGVSGILKFKRTLSLVGEKRYNEAADNALKSKWAKQTPRRAKEVTDLMRSSINI